MYERWTDRARQVLQLANELVRRNGHEYLGSGHLLWGLLAEGSGVAASVLKNFKLNLRAIQRSVASNFENGSRLRSDYEETPMTPRLKNVIGHAENERRLLHHNYVGTEHLLLGLIREQHGQAAQLLARYRLDLDAVRDEVQRVLGDGITPPG